MRALSITAALVLTSAACADSVTGPRSQQTEPAFLMSTAKERVRTFSAECQTTFNNPPFPPPPIHRQTDIGSCHFIPYGPMTVAGVQEINFAAGTQSGERTFTARNGDELRAVHTGTSRLVAPGVVSFTATLTFVGGTGRFAGVTGEARGTGIARMATSTAVFTLKGWLNKED